MRRIRNYSISKESTEDMIQAKRFNPCLEITFRDRSGQHTHKLSAGYDDDLDVYREGAETYILTTNPRLGYIGLEVFKGADKTGEIFVEEHQEAALIGLYKMLIPDWERIERLEGYPVVGRGMWKYIANLFIDFDQRRHPKFFNGGLWLNQGFSSSETLGPWEISMDRCNVIYS